MYTGASDCKTEFKKQNKKMTFPLLHHSSMSLLPQISIKSSSNIFFFFYTLLQNSIYIFTHMYWYTSV